MENLLSFQEELANKYKYKKLDNELSIEVRELYKNNLPPNLPLEGNKDFPIRSTKGTLISKGYERIVIGDYGAFIEFAEEQAEKNNYKIKKGQEYRIYDPKYSSNVKYNWLTAKDESDIKIYQQKKTVTYADYKAGMYYVSPFEILT